MLVRIKPNLTKRIQDADETLLASLDNIAALCERFLLERPRSKELAQFTDVLDREGVRHSNHPKYRSLPVRVRHGAVECIGYPQHWPRGQAKFSSCCPYVLVSLVYGFWS